MYLAFMLGFSGIVFQRMMAATKNKIGLRLDGSLPPSVAELLRRMGAPPYQRSLSHDPAFRLCQKLI
jgi:hypothetical protein